MGQTVGKGVYTYLVFARHTPCGSDCVDRDKSAIVTLNMPTLPFWAFSVQDMKVTTHLIHSANVGSADVIWDVYNPGLARIAGDKCAPAPAGPHEHDQAGFDVNPHGPFGMFTYALDAHETKDQGLQNRSGKPKPALQVGTDREIEPGALGVQWASDIPGLIEPFSDVIDNMGKTDVATGTHYEALDGSGETALVVRNQMRTAAVVLLHGHGNPRYVGAGTGPGAIVGPDRLENHDNDYYAIEDFPFRLNRTRLVLFSGCHTEMGDNDQAPPPDGLFAKATEKGANACAGFYGTVYSPMIGDFVKSFFGQMMVLGYKARNANAIALNQVLEDYLVDGGAPSSTARTGT